MDIARFKSVIKSVARPTLFEVIVSGSPIQDMDQELFKYSCKASSLPSSTLGVIEVPHFGRKIKIAGDRTYTEWNTTVIGSNSFTIYNQLQEWHNKINHPTYNTMSTDDQNQYKADVIVRTYSETGTVTKEMTLVGAWPSEIAQVELGWENNDATMDYDVTWAYDYII